MTRRVRTELLELCLPCHSATAASRFRELNRGVPPVAALATRAVWWPTPRDHETAGAAEARAHQRLRSEGRSLWLSSRRARVTSLHKMPHSARCFRSPKETVTSRVR